MSAALRACCEVCCFSPNTVSKFVRFFPKAAIFFIILHVGIMVYTLSTGVKKDVKVTKTETDMKKFAGMPVDDAKRKEYILKGEMNLPRLMANNSRNNKQRKRKGLYLKEDDLTVKKRKEDYPDQL